jgi:hypothetical protein
MSAQLAASQEGFSSVSKYDRSGVVQLVCTVIFALQISEELYCL